MYNQCASFKTQMEQSLTDQATAEQLRNDAIQDKAKMESQLADQKGELSKTRKQLDDARAVIKAEELR